MTLQQIKDNKPDGATHYIDTHGFCYCKHDNGWMALEFGEWIYCNDYWVDKIKPI